MRGNRNKGANGGMQQAKQTPDTIEIDGIMIIY